MKSIFADYWNMEIIKVTKYEDFLGLENQWNQLAQSYSDDKPFYSHQWFKVWWDSFAGKKSLHVLVAQQEEKILAIAPLTMSKGVYMGFPMRIVEFMANDHSHKIDFIYAYDNVAGVERILDYLWEQRNWDLLRLEDILESSAVTGLIEQKCKNPGFIWGKKAIRFSPYIPIESDWNSFLAKRPKKFRENMRNQKRRLSKLGDVKIEERSTIDDLDGSLAEIEEITRKSWQGKKGSSIFSTKKVKSFYVNLARWANQERLLVLWFLKLNSKPIAYEYHLRSGQTEFGLKAEYDECFRQSSPGGVLDQHIVESLFERGFSKYDLLGYMDFYKMRWTESTSKHLRYYILRKSIFTGIAFWLDFKLRYYLKRFKILRGLKKFLGGLK